MYLDVEMAFDRRRRHEFSPACRVRIDIKSALIVHGRNLLQEKIEANWSVMQHSG